MVNRRARRCAAILAIRSRGDEVCSSSRLENICHWCTSGGRPLVGRAPDWRITREALEAASAGPGRCPVQPATIPPVDDGGRN